MVGDQGDEAGGVWEGLVGVHDGAQEGKGAWAEFLMSAFTKSTMMRHEPL